MLDNPLVSVVMPTFNCKEFISLTLESVINQTYKDFEFLIVDDCSSDGTRDIINEYSKKDSRIILIDGDKQGIGGALNKGCILAKGKYIARIDADDICLPTRFQDEVDFLEDHNDVVLVHSDYYAIDEKGKVLGRSYPCSSMKVIRKLLDLQLNPIAHPTCMFRKETYLKTTGYPLTPSHEDLILWRSFVKYGDVGTINYPLVQHRMMGISLSKKFIGNPYEKVLNAMIAKIISDGGCQNEDIDIYKKVMKMASSLPVKSLYNQEKSLGEILYRSFGRFLPESLSQELIIMIKNVYLYFRYLCWK